ncbi:hypothetical protein Y032_0270g848 [Ancylostoma ceylanicum]|uniref:Peptidase S9A N-terminal domain-containing protein n=1 Tax=Ancylostoma ceylanicum TaxID=53326 RepID=A0A016S9K2_9BILA|nr:hypothetical protein Y032_0270g848 [Ancylostoma ceylanicum]
MRIWLLLLLVSFSLYEGIAQRQESTRESEALASISISPATYPTARRDNTIVDDFGGTKVADPYRWLEDPDAPETRQFVSELNAISEPFLEKAPNRGNIRETWVPNIVSYTLV